MDQNHKDYADQPKASPSNRWLNSIAVILGTLSVLLLLLGIVAYFLLFFNYEDKPSYLSPDPFLYTAVHPANGPDLKVGDSTRVYTRDEFEAIVMGKTREEVVATVGLPKGSTHGNSDPRWFYENRVIDPATEKPSNAFVQFKNNVVGGVTWQSR